MKIVSYNVNGIRAAFKKGLIEFLKETEADVVCLQEIKAAESQVEVNLLEDLGYHHHWFSAQKKGYSGVAIFSKVKPDQIFYGSGHEMSDFEGRVIQVLIHDVLIINAYFPSGTSGELRQTYKYAWLKEFEIFIKKQEKKYQKVVLCGDYNIAHEEIDIHDPKGNKNTTGFLPDERNWMTAFLKQGWIDSFRHVNKEPHHYTWWSQRFPSVRLNNKGWRIDYICVSKSLKENILQAGILPEAKHSDHCPTFLILNT